MLVVVSPAGTRASTVDSLGSDGGDATFLGLASAASSVPTSLENIKAYAAS